MKRLILGGVLCVLIGFPATVHAGGLLQSLPKNGSWVKFYMKLKMEAPQKIEMSGTYTVRSVGRSTIDGKPCRWIELHLEQTQNGKTTKQITKILVAEKDFQPKSKRPPKIIRGWIKKDGNDPRALSKIELAQFAAILATPLKDRKTFKKEKVIDYQKGRLIFKSCVTGKSFMKLGSDEPAGSGAAVTQFIWSDSSIPFGTAALQYDVQYRFGKVIGPKLTMTWTVQDYGTGAKSALPGKQ